jgi:hypothetical protein
VTISYLLTPGVDHPVLIIRQNSAGSVWRQGQRNFTGEMHLSHQCPTCWAPLVGRLPLQHLLINGPGPLHCTALHCTALHCTALHCTAWAWLSDEPRIRRVPVFRC